MNEWMNDDSQTLGLDNLESEVAGGTCGTSERGDKVRMDWIIWRGLTFWTVLVLNLRRGGDNVTESAEGFVGDSVQVFIYSWICSKFFLAIYNKCH